MQTIRLLRIDPLLAAALADGVPSFEKRYSAQLSAVAEIVREVLPPSLAISLASDPPWGSYLAVDEVAQQVIGACAFKSAPTAEGTVEIAYFTFPPFERQGYATAMARRLIVLAQSDPQVTRVLAHTLPETNPSTHILEKVGMRLVGEVWDPEDGRVWRWERERTP